MPRRPSQRDFARAVKGTKRRMDRALSLHERGKIDTPELHDRLGRMLEDRHARAAYLGRQRAGDFAPFDMADRMYGQVVAAQEDVFLRSFMKDLQNGRYTDEEGNFKTAQIRQRVRMYADRLRGTANEAFAGASDPEALFDWMLGGAEKHCGHCPDLAAGSPYPASGLPTKPGMCETPCLTNCTCILVRLSDGIQGFGPVENENDG